MSTVLITYTIKYELSISTKYKWLNNNMCYNSKTGRIIKQTICGGSIGYVIDGKFCSLKYLRPLLVKPQKELCPFQPFLNIAIEMVINILKNKLLFVPL